MYHCVWEVYNQLGVLYHVGMILLTVRLLETMRVIDDEICYRAKECQCSFQDYSHCIKLIVIVLFSLCSMNWSDLFFLIS